MLRVENIGYRIGKKTILQDINTVFLPNKFHVILGANGSGKSTFLKICAAEIQKFSGNVFYGDKNIEGEKKETLSKYRAVMSQQPILSFPLSVEDVVMMGRYPHFKNNPSKNDFVICNEVLTQMNLVSLKKRNYLSLSGGEKQRVQFARVMIQIWEQPVAGYRFLFLDEPLNNLDIKYQQQFLQIAKSFLTKQTILVSILHDINLAAQFADKLYFFKDGKLIQEGTPSNILNTNLIREVFDIETEIMINPSNDKLLLLYK